MRHSSRLESPVAVRPRFRILSPALALPLALLAFSVGLASSASAAVIAVTTTVDELNFAGDCSLREAISSANADVSIGGCTAGSGADTILLVGGGSYRLTRPGIGEDNNVTGDLDIRSSMTIRALGTPPQIIIQMPLGEPFTRVLHIRCNDSTLDDIDVTLENFEVILGFARNGEPGGGLWIEDCVGASTGESNVTIDGLTFTINSGDDGGGAIADETGGFVTIRNSAFIGNQADWLSPVSTRGGGAILVAGGGLTTIEDSQFFDNMLRPGSDQSGGAVFITSPTNLRRSSFWENDAKNGAVVSCQDTTMNLDSVTISNNIGIGAQSGSNAATGPCTLSISSSTIADNTVGGLRNQTGLITLNNNIVAGNGPGPSVDMDGVFTSSGHNFIGNLDDGIGGTDPTDLFGSTISEINPDLVPLDGNATPPIRLPSPLSPVINSGASAFAIDGRGLPRPAGSQDDRGAIELQNSDLRFSLYIDVGLGAIPSADYGAGALAPGIWNGYGLGGNINPVDTYGSATGVTVSMSTEIFSPFQFPSPPFDSERLFRDHISDCSTPEDWQMSLTGLPNGDYEVFIYAPYADTVYSGGLFVNGTPIGAITGDLLEAIEGQSFVSAFVTATNGSIDLSGADDFSSDCVGVSGVQVVPEPGLFPAVSVGILTLGFWSRRSRFSGLSLFNQKRQNAHRRVADAPLDVPSSDFNRNPEHMRHIAVALKTAGPRRQ